MSYLRGSKELDCSKHSGLGQKVVKTHICTGVLEF